jgi:predicted FMN-binding regulatory protein PaiB
MLASIVREHGTVRFLQDRERLEGKWKVSQNRSGTDRRGVEKGLRSQGTTRWRNRCAGS